MTRVLDAWAVEAMLRYEPAGPRVKAEIEAGGTVMSWINLGEVFYVELRRVGRLQASEAIAAVRRQVTVEAPDGDLVMAAARLKATGGASYADCFAMATAQRHGAPLLTGDPEILAFADQLDVVDVRPAP